MLSGGWLLAAPAGIWISDGWPGHCHWKLGLGVLSKQKARAWLTTDGRKASGQCVRQNRPVHPACLQGHHSQGQDISSLEPRTGSALVTMATTVPRKGVDT